MMLTSDISLLHDPERVFQGIVEEYVFDIFPFFLPRFTLSNHSIMCRDRGSTFPASLMSKPSAARPAFAHTVHVCGCGVS